MIDALAAAMVWSLFGVVLLDVGRDMVAVARAWRESDTDFDDWPGLVLWTRMVMVWLVGLLVGVMTYVR